MVLFLTAFARVRIIFYGDVHLTLEAPELNDVPPEGVTFTLFDLGIVSLIETFDPIKFATGISVLTGLPSKDVAVIASTQQIGYLEVVYRVATNTSAAVGGFARRSVTVCSRLI